METIRNVSINELYDFRNHPFKVEKNMELCELMRSIEIIIAQDNIPVWKSRYENEFACMNHDNEITYLDYEGAKELICEPCQVADKMKNSYQQKQRRALMNIVIQL